MSDSARAVINAIAKQWAVPGGAVVAVDRRGEIFSHVFGKSDLSSGTPVGSHHRFEIGSISKTFTSIVLLQLAEQKLVRLDAPAASVLDWVPQPLRADGITLERLLNHTAGLVASVDALPDEIGQATLYASESSPAAPGSFFHYSNLGYILLGLTAAQVSGRPLANLVRDGILAPLGMKDTIARITHDDYESLARGHQPLHDDRPWIPGDRLVPAPWLEVAGADGNLAATASDLGRFARMLLGRGTVDDTTVLSAAAFDTMLSSVAPAGEDVLDLPGVPTTESSRYGLGVNVERIEGRSVLTHGGGMVGYASFLMADLDHGLAVCVVTNANGDTPVAEAIARSTATELTTPGRVDTDRLDPRWWDASRVEELGCLGEFTDAPAEIPPMEPALSVCVSIAEHRGNRVRLMVSSGGEQAPMLRTWGRHVVTTLPSLNQYALTFDDGHWTWGAKELTPVGTGRPTDTDGSVSAGALEAFCGHYRCYSPWFTNFRVVLRRGRLVLIASGGVEAPGEDAELIAVGPSTFRIGADERLPERITFGPVARGVTPWADRDGCRYSRAFTD
ncbi:serine hydrolase domain-containing protein [Mycolicibacterium sp. 624]|uniref:serine hydrolase domain-containing protein n=1 Tax=Mycolicibacterium sp. 624 TaxID=3156314 RepID=UPI00339A857B